MKKNQIDIITLGCSKNLVDSESLMRLFQRKGFTCKHDAERVEGEYVVINTCGFIEDAKQESIDTILEFAQAREANLIKGLYVMGCLSQRYQKELEIEIPQVDKYYGKFNYKQLLEDLPQPTDVSINLPVCSKVKMDTTPSHYSYIKISEGCNRRCAYCAIPLITGKHISRPKEEILDEVKSLVSEGVKEFQVIAQELTFYGMDIDGKRHIAELIDEMAQIKGVKWIRLHYAYPNQFPFELLDVMRRHDNVCKYLDIALQHISNHMLDRMHRNTTKEETMYLIEKLREAMPGIHLRTTLMVGFPGESEEDFKELVEFVKWARFERMGAFAYSEEEGTYSAEHYEDDVPQEVKEARLSKLMRVQQSISAEIEAEKVGKTLRVIIDRREGDYYIGRTEFCSPEVDPEVLIPVANRRLRRGCFYDVKIIGAEEFDLYGDVISLSK
ncbi:MAG: 30S ribosomal protein S12 methylthiotransferase RimO [Prevotella sp.]|nr:30S ribosomal protein S12 methylthiotransferase RimO [Prevotella sp.]